MAIQLNVPRSATGESLSAAHVAVLLNFIPPHQLPVLEELAKRVRKLTVLISTPMDGNRSWRQDNGNLDVTLQRSFTWLRRWKLYNGLSEPNYIHVPWDTVWRLKALAPDVVFSLQLGPRSILSMCYKLLSPSTRLIVSLGLSEHTEQGRSRLRTLVRKRQLRHCDSVVVNGRSGQRYLESLGVDPSRIFRCPYATIPIFLDRSFDDRPPETAHRLFYPGRFVECKGILPFLQALRRWAEKNPNRTVDFDFVGDGPLERPIAEFPMPANVRIHMFPKVQYDELPAEYQARGILVLPTLQDEWAMVVNEALATGMPVLGSRYSQAVEDLCIDGSNGWTFRPNVEGEMDQAINAAMNTTCDELSAMRTVARNSVTHVSAEACAQIISDAVEHALTNPVRRKSKRPQTHSGHDSTLSEKQ